MRLQQRKITKEDGLIIESNVETFRMASQSPQPLDNSCLLVRVNINGRRRYVKSQNSYTIHTLDGASDLLWLVPLPHPLLLLLWVAIAPSTGGPVHVVEDIRKRHRPKKREMRQKKGPEMSSERKARKQDGYTCKQGDEKRIRSERINVEQKRYGSDRIDNDI